MKLLILTGYEIMNGAILILALQYLLDVVLATLFQTLILFGPLLLLAFMMNLISRTTERLGYQVCGRNLYLYGFAWLGTSVHELGHALFAILFGHKINEIRLFTPRSATNKLGYVSTSYNPGNFYQLIGNFFIGIGPILLGSLMLLVSTYLLFSFNVGKLSTIALTSDTFTNIDSVTSLGADIWNSLVHYIQLIIKGPEAKWWKVILLIYILFSIGSSITLSKADLSASFYGFSSFFLLLLLFNLATIWIGNFLIHLFITLGSYLSGLYFLMLITMALNLLFIFILLIIKNLKYIF